MAKIISLGCEVAEIRKHHARVHAALFGAPSFLDVINGLIGKGRGSYRNHQTTLLELLDPLQDLKEKVVCCTSDERTSRSAEDLQRVLLEYIEVLAKVIKDLAAICDRFVLDETEYREADESGQSRYKKDKVEYEYDLNELEYLGGKLNRLFSTY